MRRDFKMTTTQENPATKICRECGDEFTLEDTIFKLSFVVSLCPKCSVQQAEEVERKRELMNRQDRENEWRDLCPVEFQATDPSKLPSPHKLQLVLNWQYGRQGLTLHGSTGKGKSRCAWQLLKREFLNGKSISVLDCGFALTYGAKYSISAAAASK